jgi:hypothetical protein
MKLVKTKLIVQNGQYEVSATKIIVRHKTWRGLVRRIGQLQREYATYGDNWAGWIPAQVALASNNDVWGDNQIIGGQWCKPNNGWLTNREDEPGMSYEKLQKRIYHNES